MSRAAAMLLLGTLALVPSRAGADEVFSCKDADGNWVFGNVEQHRCVGKVKRTGMGHSPSHARRPSGISGAEARGLMLGPAAYKEYEEHIRDKKCRAHACAALSNYVVVPDACKGCGICKKNCPVNAISGEPKGIYEIDGETCIKCGICEAKCPFDAIVKA